MEGNCSNCGSSELYSKGRCRPCYDKNHRATNLEYAERQKKNSRDWGKRFPEKKKSAWKRKWAKLRSDPLKWKAYSKRRAAQQYGLTVEEYQALVSQPCGLCGTTDRERYADHCHTTGKVRGALCHGCNLGMGFLDKRGLPWAKAAVKWMVKHKEIS